MRSTAAKRVQLRIMVEATLSGHDLTPFEPVDPNGRMAHCRHCGYTVWVSDQGLLYSLLPDSCPKKSPGLTSQ
jgi:hypothetical protein